MYCLLKVLWLLLPYLFSAECSAYSMKHFRGFQEMEMAVAKPNAKHDSGPIESEQVAAKAGRDPWLELQSTWD